MKHYGDLAAYPEPHHRGVMAGNQRPDEHSHTIASVRRPAPGMACQKRYPVATSRSSVASRLS